MDCKSVAYGKDRFIEVKMEVSNILNKIGFNSSKINFIPVSGWEGDNLTERSIKMPWYEGPTVLEALDALIISKILVGKPLRLVVEDVYKVGGIGTVVAGKVLTGSIHIGMEIVCAKNQLKSYIKSM